MFKRGNSSERLIDDDQKRSKGIERIVKWITSNGTYNLDCYLTSKLNEFQNDLIENDFSEIHFSNPSSNPSYLRV